ncbi:11392_t:CDS:10 [Entrophospora sp. SA101]|nr:11392_t:CDS:10 [Entrophospora sp. SA101]
MDTIISRKNYFEEVEPSEWSLVNSLEWRSKSSDFSDKEFEYSEVLLNYDDMLGICMMGLDPLFPQWGYEKTYAVQKFWEEYKSICLDNRLTTLKYVVNKSNEATIHSDLIGERRHQILEDELKSKRKISSSLINEVTSTQPTKKQKQSDVKPGIGDEGFEDVVDIKVIKKKKIDELFKDMRNHNIYILCEPFRSLLEADAEDLFEVIVRDTVVEIDIPEDIKEYLCNLLSESIESALSKVEKPLNGDEKTCGEIVNEAHKDGIYNVNVNQKPASSRKGDKNDAVLYQDQTAMIIYEQSFGPTEFDMTHYLEDITKLAHNGVDNLNYHFIQYGNSSIMMAKKFKSIRIHGYKYFISIYLTDLVWIKT